MEELKVLAGAVDLLERIQMELAGIATRQDEARKRDLFELRRRLAAQIGEVGRMAEPVLAARGDDAMLQTYRKRFSRMRSAAAMHQATWPAVSLGEREDEYRASAMDVREANREFVSWMRRMIVGGKDSSIG